MELGMGIHGESGVQQLKLVPVRQAVDLALGQLLIGPRTLDLKPDNNVLLFVNNLGLSLFCCCYFNLCLLFRWLFES